MVLNWLPLIFKFLVVCSFVPGIMAHATNPTSHAVQRYVNTIDNRTINGTGSAQRPGAGKIQDADYDYHVPSTDLEVTFSDFGRTVSPALASQVVFKAYDKVLSDCMEYSHQDPEKGDFSYTEDDLFWTYRDAALYINLVPESQVPLRVSYVKAMLKALAWFIAETHGSVTLAHFTLAENGREICDGAWNVDVGIVASSAQKETGNTDRGQNATSA